MKLRRTILMFFLSMTLVAFPCCQKNETKYKVSFMTNGGSSIDVVETTGTISEPAAPTRAGFTFAGWYTDSSYVKKFDFSTSLTSSTTLYARWKAQLYTITYNLGEGTNSGINPTVYSALQNDIRLVNATCNTEGRYFAGWYTEEAYTNKILIIKTDSAKNYNLYAKWSSVEQATDYAIIYNLDGGTNGNNPTSFNKNDENITLSPATKEGYTFKGWYKEASFTTVITEIDTSVESDYTIYAKFEQNSVGPTEPEVTKYKITYHLNGGSNGDNPPRYTEDSENIVLKNPTKISSTFKGWFADEALTTPISEIDCSQKKDVDVYAKWFDGITELVYDLDLGIGSDYVLYHVSDTHIHNCVTDNDRNNENDWITSTRYQFANSFGENYNSKNLYQSSTENFKAIINFINNEGSDAVCFTGDLMNYYTTANYNFINTEIVKLDSPFVYALGNHEDPSSVCDNIAGIANTSFQVLDFGDFEIVCMDNSYKDDDENYSYSEEQYQALLTEVAKNKPIIIAQHIPLLTKDNCDSRIEKCGTYFYIDENACSSTSKKVIDLIVKNANVKLVLCGHIHGGTETEIAPGKKQITCTSGLIGIINKIIIH